MARTCKRHNIKDIATYGDCPECIKELTTEPTFVTGICDGCGAGSLELREIAYPPGSVPVLLCGDCLPAEGRTDGKEGAL